MTPESLAKFTAESGLRKFTAGLYMFTGLLLARCLNGLTPEEFRPLCMTIVVALMAANAYEHHTKTRAKKKEAKPDEPA